MYYRSILAEDMNITNIFDRKEKNTEIIIIDNKKCIEIVNHKYILTPSDNISQKRPEALDPPIKEEESEKQYIIHQSKKCLEYFLKDINTRKAAFLNSYNGLQNNCLAYFHYLIRNCQLQLNVYVRSQNFDKNWTWDNFVYSDAYIELLQILKYNNIVLYYGNINVFIGSLHRIVLNERQIMRNF